MLKFIAFTLPCLLIPQDGLPWAETGHAIEEVLVQRLVLTEDFVFCGTDAYWGTNVYGLFVFDRRTEKWTNYCTSNGFPSNTVKGIYKKGKSVDVMSQGRVIRFDSNAEIVQIDTTKYSGRTLRTFTVNAGDKTYMFKSDTIVISDGAEERIYLPGISLPRHPITKAPLRYYGFSHPIVYEDKVFFAYNSDGTLGLDSVDLEDTIFRFYPSDIFKGRVTGAFIYNSSIIFSTAHFVYEGNAGPAAGFVQFSPADSSFQIWQESPLPDYPLAIFSLGQDRLECWIGTDRGVFRIDRKTNKCIHYNIAEGVVVKDAPDVHSYYGHVGGENRYPVVATLTKNETVEILATHNAWCQIRAPVDVRGFVLSSEVEAVSDKPFPRTVLIPLRTEVRLHPNHKADPVLVPDDWRYPIENEYAVVGSVADADTNQWYEIEIPTAWIHRDDMTFSFDEVQ